MLRIGLVSAGSYGASYRDPSVPRTPGSFHGTAFASTFNGFDAEKKAALYDPHKYTFSPAGVVLEEGRIVKVWDPLRESAEILAEVCSIPEVCDTAEECSSGVDAVIIVDDGSAKQYQYAFAPLRAGIPVFCDKPLAMTTAEAKQVQAVVEETGTKFMSASSLRFVPDIVKLRDEIAAGALGNVPIVSTACGNDLVYYGIHALCMYLGVFPHDEAISCLNVGQEGRNIVRVRYASGRDLVLVVGEMPHMSGGWQITVYSEKGWRLMQPDLTNLYMYLLQAFMDYVLRDECTVPVGEEVAVIATLEAGRRSLVEGREVAVAEILG